MIANRLRPPSPRPQPLLHKPLYPMIAHKEVASVARAAAGELFDSLMHNNEIWEAWRKQNPGRSRKELERLFIQTFAPDCVPFARATMAHMLSLPGLEAATKDQIVEALILDAQLPGRQPREQAVDIVNREILK